MRTRVQPQSATPPAFAPPPARVFRRERSHDHDGAAGGEHAGHQQRGTPHDAILDLESSGSVPAAVQDALDSPGRPLESATRVYMESRFGHDFGRVRVHPDAQAAEAARRLNSLAFTSGQEIFFGGGMYRPETQSGRRLLAHELAHTLQQGEAPSPARTPIVQRSLAVSRPGDRLEREADAAADLVADGRRIAPGAISLAVTKGLIARRVASLPTRDSGSGHLEAEELTGNLAKMILQSLRTDPEDLSGRVRRRLGRLGQSTREAVLEKVEARATPEQSAQLARILAAPHGSEARPDTEESPTPETPRPDAEVVPAESRAPAPDVSGELATVEDAPAPEIAEATTPDADLDAAAEEQPAAAAPTGVEGAEGVPVPEVQADVLDRAAESADTAPPAAAGPAAPGAEAAPSPVAVEEGAPEADTGPIEELEAEESGPAEEDAEAEAEDQTSPPEPVPEPAEPIPTPDAENRAEPSPDLTTPEPALEGTTEEPAEEPAAGEAADPLTPEEAGADEGGLIEGDGPGGPEPGTELEPGGLDLGATFEESPDTGAEAPAGGGGGGGVPIPEPPVPAVPDVSQSDPAQALASVSALPPSRLGAALGGVSAAASHSVGEQRAELNANPPQVERPFGAHGTQEAPAAAREAPPLPGGARRVERAPEGRPAHGPGPAPLPPAPAPPTQSARPPQVGNAPQGGLSAEDAQALRASLHRLPTRDPALDVAAGPPPALTLEGDADPGQAREQRVQLNESMTEARTHGQQDAAQPMGEDELFPDVPQETLRAEVPAGEGGGAGRAGPAAAAGAAPAAGPAAGADDEAASIIAREQRGEQISAAVAQAQADVSARRQEHATQAAQHRADAQGEMDGLVNRNAEEQARERTGAGTEVGELRGQWNEAQQDLVDRSQGEADTAAQEGVQDLTRERTQAEERAARHIQDGNRQAEDARQGAEAQAARERQNAERESRGILGWLADRATAFFNEVKNRIQRAFEAARAAVRSAIQTAQRLAAGVIEGARRAIVGIIRRVGDALISIGDRLLAGFPGLRDRFRAAIRERVARAEAAVNRLAGALKDGVQRALNLLGSALNAALGLLERGMLAAVDAARQTVQRAIEFGRSVVQGLAAFAALIRDIAANPGQWIRNLAAAVMDGIRNHLWAALKTAIQGWFSSKVDEVLGLGMSVWQMLRQGGIALARVARMAWEGLKQAIPMVLIQILIQRLVSMIVPAIGAVMVVIEGLQAAWGTVSRIIQAIERFLAFLRAVRGGSAGPLFAQALAAAAVAVIDFVSNWLLTRLRRPAGAIAGRIRAIAQRIGQRLRRLMQGIGRRLRRFGQRLRGGLRGLRARFQRRQPARQQTREERNRIREERQARARETTISTLRNLLTRGIGGLLLKAHLLKLKLQHRWRTLRIRRNENAGTFEIYGGFSPESKLIEGSEQWRVRLIDYQLTRRPSTGAEFEQAVAPYIRGPLAQEIFGGGAYEVTYPAQPVLEMPAHPAHRLASRIDQPRVKFQRGMRGPAGMLRRPDVSVEVYGRDEGERRRALREVHIIEATLVTDFMAESEFAAHKRIQIPGTLFILQQRHQNQPNVQIKYHIIAPEIHSEGTKDFIMGELNKLGMKNVQFIWRHFG